MINADIYTLKHKDIDVIYFWKNNSEILNAAIIKVAIKYLPLSLKRIIYNTDEFVEQPEDKDFFILNGEGIFLLDNWLSDREIPLSRDNYNAYIKKELTARQWMFENYAMSFTDCYWIEKENNEINWNLILR